jgi:putative DNA primase/helicase
MDRLKVDQRFYKHLNIIHNGGKYAYYWTPNGAGGAKISYWHVSLSAPPVPDELLQPGVNVYYGVHPSNARGKQHTRSRVENIDAVNCLYAEFDCGRDQEKKDAVLEMLSTLPHPPSVVIDSGGGLHAYWYAAQTWLLVDDIERQTCADVQTAWVRHLPTADQTAHDLARVLRVPGTINYKEKYGPDYPTVQIVEWHPERMYAWEDLREEVEDIRKANNTQTADPQPVDLDDAEILLKAFNDDKFRSLFFGDMGAYGDDHSRADQAFCNMLAFWTGKDPERMDRLFRMSKLYRQKWERRDYRDKTIQKAIADTQNVYSPLGSPARQAAVSAADSLLDDPPPKPPPSYLLTLGVSDEDNAECVNRRYAGQFLYNDAFGWMYYTGTHWKREGAEAKVDRAIVDTIVARGMAAYKSGRANQYTDLIRKCIPNNARVQGAKALLQSKVYCPTGEFNADPDLLNCPNGVVNLRTGDLIPHTPEQRFTHCATVDYIPDADPAFWLDWLTEATNEDDADFLQLAAGYSLTGHTQEEVLFYLYGPTRSGKGVFLETLCAMLGSPLAEAVSFNLLTAPRDSDAQNFQLAPLHASRLIVASESNQYERFNEAKLKQVTGGDSIQAAYKRQTSFTFRPPFKIWLSSNQPVNADPDDDAVWGRIREVAFPTSHLGKEDKTLKERMRSKPVLQGVLAWAVKGAIRWYALGSAGLPEPSGSKALKTQQRSALDNIATWIDECCELDPASFEPSKSLYASYRDWCIDNGVEAKKLKGFSTSLVHKGLTMGRETIRGTRVRGFYGLRIL